MASHHRLPRGLPGYLILFDTHAFVHERQSRCRTLPPQSAFCVISMHFTATPRIPRPSNELQPGQFQRRYGVEPRSLTADLTSRLRTL